LIFCNSPSLPEQRIFDALGFFNLCGFIEGC
jgi:hypothetical protein